jgi:hypothetical protein
LNDAETRYATLELEALAIYWAIKKCELYLSGLPHFLVITDHKPLIPLFNQFALGGIENPRVQDYRTKLLNYTFSVEWRKGKEHAITDALSRAPDEDPEDTHVADEFHIRAVITESVQQISKDLLLSELREHAQMDSEYLGLIEAVVNDFSDHSKLSPYARHFLKFKDELSFQDGLVIRGCRIVIPPIAKKYVLKRLHSSHQGIEKTKRRARQSVYWPGHTNDITNLVKSCSLCQYHLPSGVSSATR